MAKARATSMNNRQERTAAPLSFAQQRLWFLDQWEPMSPLYNITRALRMTGSLNVEALRKALDEVVSRHEVLRTTFAAVDGNPVQQIREAVSATLPLIDLTARPESQRQAEMQRLVREEARRPFNLASDLMLRASLLRLGDEEHILILTMHHIASDGWSLALLFQELSVLYEAFCAGKTSPLPELPIQYADFAQWQRNWLQGDILESQLGYWKKQLAGAPALLELPTDRPRPAAQTFRGASQTFDLPSNLAGAIKSLSRSEKVTFFITLLAAFQTLLHRYTGGEDIVVGSPIAGRNRYEIEELIGFFVNTLVLRASLSGNPTFRELLGRVRDVAFEAYEHQDLPFERLVEELHPERNLSHNPLFQVMFVLQNTPRLAFSFPGLALTELKVERETAKFDLSLSVFEKAGELIGAFEYNTDLFESATIHRMIGHFRTLLEGIAADPDRRLSDLPLLTEAERRRLLIEWNETKKDYPKDKCLHQLFEEQVERTPDAVAATFPSTGSGQAEDQRLTYRELNRRANQLAHHLQRLGVGPEVVVGICMERSLEMIVSLLAILKAGGAYAPLDPAYPKERLAFMLEDSGARVLLTQRGLVSQLPEMTDGRRRKTAKDRPQTTDHGPLSSSMASPSAVGGLRSSPPSAIPAVICLDSDCEVIAQESEENPASGATADNLAYIIYTSGSTGKPKGVLITHGSIACHCLDVQKNYSLDSKDRVLQSASLSFDVSLEQIFATLLVGGTLVLRKPGVLAPTDFYREIVDSKITVVNIPPAFWGQLAQEWSMADLSPAKQLKLLVVGGDLMPPKDLQVWRQTPMNPVRLLNAYGPTETTITATTFEIPSRSQEIALRERIPIGRPLGDRKIYLLDAHLQPVPIGVPGELHIGGQALARGYLNHPELTAEKFIPDPFSPEPGARLYKTGDLARYLPDGNIEFLGRIDQQVKIRGFRIELEEIEAVLGQHAAVEQAVVAARQDSQGDNQLVAYVVSKQKAGVSELRAYLKQKLPEYMIPSAFVFLEALPLTPSGKIDRRALPAPEQSRPELKEAFVAPRTPAEKRIVEIWTEVLKIERVGIHDNFFDLGGHSLLATQVISRLRKFFQIEMPLRSLFENPTVAELAEQVAQVQASKEAPQAMADILADVESLSDEEAERLVARKSAQEV